VYVLVHSIFLTRAITYDVAELCRTTEVAVLLATARCHWMAM